MKRGYFNRAGRLKFIQYNREVVISVGERGYARLEVRPPTLATLRRLDGLARRRFGSAPTGADAGIVYRSPWAFLRELWRTQLFVWRATRGAHRARRRHEEGK